MPRYRAILERPDCADRTVKAQQVFGVDRGALESWCKMIGDSSLPEGCEAVVYEQIERPVFRVRKTTDLAGQSTPEVIHGGK